MFAIFTNTSSILVYLQLLPVGEGVVKSRSDLGQLLGELFVQVLLLKPTLFGILLDSL